MKRRLAIAGVLMSVGALCSCGGESSAIDKILTDRIAYIGTVPFEPPLLYQKEGELVGPDAEIGKRLVAKLDAMRRTEEGTPVRLMWVNRTYRTLLQAVAEHELDLAIAVLAITDSRKQMVDFSDPYYTMELVLAVNPIHRDLEVSDLASAKIGVRAAAAAEEFVRSSYPNAVVVQFETLDDSILALRRAEVDAVIDDRYLVAYSLATTPGASHMELLPDALAKYDCGVAVRKGDSRLVKLVNEVIAEMKAENVYARLLEEHGGLQALEEVMARRQARLEEEARRERERQVSISVTRDPSFDFDIYKMANLQWILRNDATGATYQSSRINFEGRVGKAVASVPPATYTLSLPRFNFSAPLTISPEDADRINVNITIGAGGVVIRKG